MGCRPLLSHGGSAVAMWSVWVLALSSIPVRGVSAETPRVTTASRGSEGEYATASDGAGGVFACWNGPGDGVQRSLLVQHSLVSGKRLWGKNGTLLGLAGTGTPAHMSVVPDGADGAVVFWVVEEPAGLSGTIRTLHVDADGAIAEQDSACVIATLVESRSPLLVTADGVGGALVCWTAARADGAGRVLSAQRVGPDGRSLWDVSRIIATSEYYLAPVSVTTDSLGGAVVWWRTALRGDPAPQLRAQRVTASGILEWQNGGILIEQSFSPAGTTASVTDGAGGAFVTWCSARGASLRSQHVLQSGRLGWSEGGVVVARGQSRKVVSSIIRDATHGVYLNWHDYRYGVAPVVLCQRLDSLGVMLWDHDGVRPTTSFAPSRLAPLSCDGSGNLLIAWEATSRGGSAQHRVWMQKLAPDGGRSIGWPTEGVPLGTAGPAKHIASVAQEEDRVVVASTRLILPGRFSLARYDTALDRFVVAGGMATTGSPARLYRRARPTGMRIRLRARARVAWATSEHRGSPYVSMAEPVPNPAVGPVRLRVTGLASTRARVYICKLDGSVVRTVFDGPVDVGMHDFRWDLRLTDHSAAPKGTYVAVYAAGGSVVSRKLIVL